MQPDPTSAATKTAQAGCARFDGDDPEWWAAYRARRDARDRAHEIIADADAAWWSFIRGWLRKGAPEQAADTEAAR